MVCHPNILRIWTQKWLTFVSNYFRFSASCIHAVGLSFKKSNREGGYWERHLIVLLTIYAKELALIYAGFFIFYHYREIAMFSSSIVDIKKCYNYFRQSGRYHHYDSDDF
jgi:hypothetical protein